MADFSLVIPSRNLDNLSRCVGQVLDCEKATTIYRDQIIVVDDDETGAIKQWCQDNSYQRIQGVKPFIFARNTNLGLAAAFAEDENAILMNDDALLLSRNGFSILVSYAKNSERYGILSAATNYVGNTNQLTSCAAGIRYEPKMLCFVCVLIKKAVWDRVGPLDDRYCEDYGCEDGDYSYRVRKAGFDLGIVDNCFVDHKSLQSTYRPDGGYQCFQANKLLFERKWGFVYGSQ